MHIRVIGLACLFAALVMATLPSRAQGPASRPAVARPVAPRPVVARRGAAVDVTQKFFQQRVIPELRLDVSDEAIEKLRQDPRAYVAATLREDGKQVYEQIGIKLKGAAGSFREIDDRPAFTLSTTKFGGKTDFHGLQKFHLNNSVQDETYLNELLCSELFLKAGLPATRVAHARVWLNDRDLGLYVLKEGFDKAFLKRHFQEAHGNFYDGGFLQDIDVDLEKDFGKGPDDHSDLHALAEACREPDPELRWQKVAELVDIERFITFMAMEAMTCHWDGYSYSANNYRLYFNPESQKWVFIPHGMDQMFGDAGSPLFVQPTPMLSQLIMQHTPWRQRYRARLAELLPLFAPADALLRRVDTVTRRLQPVLHAMSPETAEAHRERVQGLREVLRQRAENLREQIASPEPEPLDFTVENEKLLTDWQAVTESGTVVHTPPEDGANSRAFVIACEPGEDCVASWRQEVLLRSGRYRLIAQARTREVVALEEERTSGVGLRTSGAERTASLTGTTEGSPLEFEFTVLEDQRLVVLVAELRARSGTVWFEADSLKLVRLGDRPAE